MVPILPVWKTRLYANSLSNTSGIISDNAFTISKVDDCVYKTIADLHRQIEIIKEKFPKIIKKVSILSFGKRIVTNKENFLY